MKALVDKRTTIITQVKKTAKNNEDYKKAVKRSLELIKHDIDAIAYNIIKATVKALKKRPERKDELTRLIDTMKHIVKLNARPLYESLDEDMLEALEVFPATFVVLTYAKDKLTRYGYMKYIKMRYESLGESADMFSFVEPYLWKYMAQTTIQYYRGLISDQEFADQSRLVMNIMKTKDVAPLFV